MSNWFPLIFFFDHVTYMPNLVLRGGGVIILDKINSKLFVCSIALSTCTLLV